MVGIKAECHHRLAHRNAGAVARIEHARDRNVPATARLPSSVEAKRTPSSSANPTTSIAKGNRLPAAVEIGDAGDRGDHAERAVLFAGVAHGVEMRAEHQTRQAGPVAFVAAADIADRVEMRGHAGLAHPGQNQIGGVAVLRRKKNPRQMLRRLGDGPELVNAGNNFIAKR